MPSERFHECAAVVLDREGRFTIDQGGWTMYGISKNAHPEAFEGEGTEEILWRGERYRVPQFGRALRIYHDEYWVRIKGDELPEPLDLHVFDHAINAGWWLAALHFQEIIGTTKDGIIGPKTIERAEWYLRNAAALDLLDRRLAFYAFLAEKDPPRHASSLPGWRNRIKHLRGTLT